MIKANDIKVNDRIQDKLAGHTGGVVVEILADEELAIVQWDNPFNDKIVRAKVWLHLIEKVTG
jgi:hypothetical protein